MYADPRPRAFRTAQWLQLLLLAYWVTIETVEIFPLNDIRGRVPHYEPATALAVNLLQQIAYMALFAARQWWPALAAALGYAAYLALQLWTWWVPYLFGASPDWQARHSRNFERTLKLLPSSEGHPAPDLQHMLLQLLTVAALIATARAARSLRRA
jgi:hypothetical protein